MLSRYSANLFQVLKQVDRCRKQLYSCLVLFIILISGHQNFPPVQCMSRNVILTKCTSETKWWENNFCYDSNGLSIMKSDECRDDEIKGLATSSHLFV